MNASVAEPLATLIPGFAGRGAIDSHYLAHHFRSAMMQLS